MIGLSLLLPSLVGCQMLKNRKPQSAGSNAYCSDCLVKDIDEDVAKLRDTLQQSNPNYQTVKTPIPVRSAVVFNKDGKPVCRVDLLNHPDLVPNFAKPAEQMVHQTNKSKRKLASTKSEETDLPPCSDKHLSLLKKVATNNIVVNSDKSHIHKTGWGKIATDISAAGAACFLGFRAYSELRPNLPPKSYPDADIAAAGAASALWYMGVRMREFDLKLLQKEYAKGSNPSNNQKNTRKKMTNKLKRNRMANLVAASATFCYSATGMIMFFRN